MDTCRRRLLLFLAVPLMATVPAIGAAPASARGCAHAGTPVNTISKKVIRAAVVCLINQQRADHHLPAVHVSPALDRSAQGWTNAMLATGDFSHGYDFAARLSAAGFNWSAAAENIATGFHTPRAVVRGWMSSTGHCQNILSPVYQDVGTGVSGRPLMYGFGTWTQDFGLLAGHRPPSGNDSPANGCPYYI